jgi:chaperonin GroEL (HSP60 family)
MRMALEVEQLALNEKGKESIAIESFARALKQLPTIISDNAGLDSAEIVSNLRNTDWGLGIGDWGLGPIPNPQSPIPKLNKLKLALNNTIIL